MYLVFTRMPGESYRRRLRSLLLYLCYVFLELINSLFVGFMIVLSGHVDDVTNKSVCAAHASGMIIKCSL